MREFVIMMCIVPAISFQSPLVTSCGPRSASLRGIQSLKCISEGQAQVPLPRRALGFLALAAVSQALLPQSKALAAGADSSLQDWKADANNGFSNYTSGELGVKFKDIAIGLGSPPKAGDYVRFQLSAYLLDGTLISSYAGVEQSQVMNSQFHSGQRHSLALVRPR